MVRCRLLDLLACCCVVGSMVGCERQPIIVETVVPETQLRLMKINAAYNAFIDRFGRAPRNEKELLPMLATEDSAEDAAETLLSPSDGQPLVICYGVNLLGDLSWAESTPVMAYERRSSGQAGGGKRWVLTVPGAILQLSEAEIRSASFPPGHEPVFEYDSEGTP